MRFLVIAVALLAAASLSVGQQVEVLISGETTAPETQAPNQEVDHSCEPNNWYDSSRGRCQRCTACRSDQTVVAECSPNMDRVCGDVQQGNLCPSNVIFQCIVSSGVVLPDCLNGGNPEDCDPEVLCQPVPWLAFFECLGGCHLPSDAPCETTFQVCNTDVQGQICGAFNGGGGGENCDQKTGRCVMATNPPGLDEPCFSDGFDFSDCPESICNQTAWLNFIHCVDEAGCQVGGGGGVDDCEDRFQVCSEDFQVTVCEAAREAGTGTQAPGNGGGGGGGGGSTDAPDGTGAPGGSGGQTPTPGSGNGGGGNGNTGAGVAPKVGTLLIALLLTLLIFA